MFPEKPNVLVVEDSPTQARTLRGVLDEGGIQVDTVGTLAQALEWLGANAVDLIILDLTLPDSSGLDTLTRLHGSAPAVPIIVLTTLADENAATQALKLGAQDYLIKGAADTRTIIRSIRYAIERDRAQKALRESEERFHLLVDGATDYAIFMLDPDGRLVTWNAGAERITGYTAEECVGQHFSMFYTDEDKARGVPEQALRKAAAEGRIEDERWRVRKDGTRFWGNTITTALRDEKGNLRGFARVARDMTERKLAEEVLREKEVLEQKTALVEILQSVTVAINKAATVEEAVRTCLEQVCTHTGWDVGCAYMVVAAAPDELAVKRIWFAEDQSAALPMPASDDTEFVLSGVGAAGEAWAHGKPVWRAQITPGEEPGNAALIEQAALKSCFALPVLEGGNVTVILEFLSRQSQEIDQPFVDLMANIAQQLAVVIERRRLEEELIRQAAELARSNAELQEFAKIAAHDLQEPLRAVQGFIGLLAKRYKGRLDKDADKFFHLIFDATERMVQLIRGVLEHSRVGMQARPLQDTECFEVVNEVLENLNLAIAESGAKIIVDPLPALRADRLLLVQLFQNLISNAIKYRSTDPPVIHVSAGRKGPTWLFSVKDNGIGIEPRHARRIFGMFSRLHGKTEYAGTGIGLAICKKIVEYHGGKIWVESEPGKGSTFFISFPAEQESGDSN